MQRRWSPADNDLSDGRALRRSEPAPSQAEVTLVLWVAHIRAVEVLVDCDIDACIVVLRVLRRNNIIASSFTRTRRLYYDTLGYQIIRLLHNNRKAKQASDVTDCWP